MKLEVTPVFSYPIAETIISDINGDNIIDRLKKEKYNSTNYSANNDEDVDIFISENLNILQKFPRLNKAIHHALRSYIHDVLEYRHVDYQMTNSWGTITPPGGKCQRHMHSNSWISGIYYPKMHTDGGEIKFYNPRTKFLGFGSPNRTNLFNSMEHSYTPLENMLILFDSSLEHQITKNLSNKDRHSIAFNVFPIGHIGSGDSQLTISIK